MAGNKKIVLIGANGQLGTDLRKVLNSSALVPLTRKEIDVCDFDKTRKALFDIKPGIVINTSAFNRVDDAEEEPEKAFLVNTYAVRNLAQICEELRCVFMHISTDYVFGGERKSPYKEDDLPNPLSVYGVSKLAGEYFVKNICQKHFIVRTSGLYGVAGSSGKGGNFVETMIRFAKEHRPIRVVNDQVLTPTYTKDLAEKLAELIETEAYGLYHITNSGQCSWYEFAVKIFELTELKPDLTLITSSEFGAKAKRPSYSVLSHSKILEIGLSDLRHWQEALADYLREKGLITVE